MDLATKFTLSASMLLTGFVIVFAVLFFLIFIIWFYGKIVTAGINSAEKRREKKKAAETKKQQEVKVQTVEPVATPKPVSNGVTDEVVAVISAAVYSMYGSTDKVKIKSIKKASGRSAWANAGVLNNTRPF
ncbi:MAG: OadG family protein [Oscillospiraceae bacterium]|nr:OadG family protein [Oscillospiraceae bacterium]